MCASGEDRYALTVPAAQKRFARVARKGREREPKFLVTDAREGIAFTKHIGEAAAQHDCQIDRAEALHGAASTPVKRFSPVIFSGTGKSIMRSSVGAISP